MVIENAGQGALWLLAGATLGLMFFRLLALNCRLYADGGALLAMGLHIGRLAVTVLLLVLAAKQGAVPLMALLAGFLAVRPLLVRRYGRA